MITYRDRREYGVCEHCGELWLLRKLANELHRFPEMDGKFLCFLCPSPPRYCRPLTDAEWAMFCLGGISAVRRAVKVAVVGE